jgi:hypothetical protein
MAAASPLPFMEDEKVLRDLLQQSGNSRFELPPLVQEKSWLDGLTERFLHWLDRLLNSTIGTPSLDGTMLMKLLLWAAKITVILLIVGIVVWVAKEIYRRLTQDSDPKLPSSARVSREATLEEVLLTSLQQALSQEDLATAARLRWRLFLYRVQAPDSLTPWESVPRYPRLQTQEQNSWILLLYRLMFRTGDALPETYYRMDAELAQLEAGGKDE